MIDNHHIFYVYFKNNIINLNNMPIDWKREDLLEMVWCDLINGLSRYQILQKMKKDAYEGFTTSEVSDVTKYKLIRDAYKLCHTEITEKKERLRDVLYERVLAVYNDSFTNRERKTALEALKYLGKLTGVEEPEKVDVNANVNSEVTITFGFEKLDDEEEEE